MWTPQLLFCLAAVCYIGEGRPQETEAQCREHITGVMVIQMRMHLPHATIRAARCHRDDVPA